MHIDELIDSFRGHLAAVGKSRPTIRAYARDVQLEEAPSFWKKLVYAGVPLDRVAQLLGHESVDTTRICTRLTRGTCKVRWRR